MSEARHHSWDSIRGESNSPVTASDFIQSEVASDNCTHPHVIYLHDLNHDYCPTCDHYVNYPNLHNNNLRYNADVAMYTPVGIRRHVQRLFRRLRIRGS